MKRHQTASPIRIGIGSEDSTTARATNRRQTAAETRRQTAVENRARTRPARTERSLKLASPSVRRHTLSLSGELTHSSAHTLEVEIERLCEEGVTAITLDLRELTYIDSIGVAVIAFRSRLCQKRGYEFSLIAGKEPVHRAFEQAGVIDLLPFEKDDVGAPRLRVLALGERSAGGGR
jgi:anti-anti-sigma factor